MNKIIEISNFDTENIEYLKAKIEEEKAGISENSHYRLVENQSSSSVTVSVSEKARRITADALINSKF